MVIEKGGVHYKKMDYDIVCSAWRHAGVHKRTNKCVATFIEHKDKDTPMGKNYEGKDIRTLPNGSGYMYLRMAINNIVNWFIPYCDTLILVSHVKSKQIRTNSEEMEQMSVDLNGKTGDILCGLADAVGYVFRRDNQTILSFKAGDSIIKGARPEYLRNKEFVAIESDEEGNLTYPQLKEVFI